ncbi:hypothetical protein EOD39_9043 [Acipenser ruthenus]|uniref:Uncharacterized protein n=1 Tax=Acipenser ruthenus TaxID=7906 RepID=A0A444U1Z1_ACIRT|nr:hypothetical protein EOD39_9043 [Acipenser ruthenus]
MSKYDIKNKAATLVQTYPSDLDEYFPSEMLQFTKCVSGKDKRTAFDHLQLILNSQVISTFPKVTTALRISIYLSLMCTNCSGELSFSCMGLIKNKLRVTMNQDRLNSIAIMSTEHDILRKLDFTDIIRDFAQIRTI